MTKNGITVTVPFGKIPDHRFNIQPEEYTQETAEMYVSMVVKEINIRSKNFRGITFSTVFFAGCAPSLLTLDQMYRILQALYDRLAIIPEEQTLMLQPNTIDNHKVKVLRESGFDQMTLRFTGEQVPIDDFAILKEAGFHSIGFELITDPKTNWQKTFSQLMSVTPDHIYLLPPPNDEITIPGYNQFIPHHFARPGKENLHLQNFYRNAIIAGFGLAAISCKKDRIQKNPTNLKEYLVNK